mgnify:CR=1 FL=1
MLTPGLKHQILCELNVAEIVVVDQYRLVDQFVEVDCGDSCTTHFFCIEWSLIEVYMAYPFVSQLDIGLNLESLCIHRYVHLNRVKDKHVTFSSCMSDKLAFILDEATFLVESYFHSVLDNLANRDQILCDS